MGRSSDGIATGAGTLLGARSSQEDAFLIADLGGGEAVLAILADGMGGHAAGALASKTAVAAFRDAFVATSRRPSDLGRAFDAGLAAANRAVANMQAGWPEREGMGTTLLAAHVSARGVAWISVGDSLLLLRSGPVLRRLNDDHSLRGQAEGAGGNASTLRSAVMGRPIALVDAQPEPVRLSPGDRVVLASDGVLSLVMDDVAGLLQDAEARPAQAAADGILRAVERAGHPGQDNCTVLVVDGPDAAYVRRSPGRSATSALLLAALGLTAAGVVVFALFR